MNSSTGTIGAQIGTQAASEDYMTSQYEMHNTLHWASDANDLLANCPMELVVVRNDTFLSLSL